MNGRKEYASIALPLPTGDRCLRGCATAAPESPDAPLACVVVDNTQGAGRHSRIFLVGEETGTRQFMGEAGAGRILRHCTRRFSLPMNVRVVIERPSNEKMDPAENENQPPPIDSGPFLLGPWDEWTWDVDADRLTPQVNGARRGA